MTTTKPAVSLHPYFKIHEGALDAFKALLPKFVERTASEEKCLYYEFTMDHDTVFCREAYADADGVRRHLENVGILLEKALEISDLIRLEVHGPIAELEKLENVFGDLTPSWFHYECGVER